MKAPLILALLLIASHSFANELLGDWVEVETGLGMNIKEKGIIILNSRGENPISGTWSSPKENQIRVKYSEGSRKVDVIIPFLIRDGYLVFPSQSPGSREEVYKRSPKKKEVEPAGAGQPDNPPVKL